MSMTRLDRRRFVGLFGSALSTICPSPLRAAQDVCKTPATSSFEPALMTSRQVSVENQTYQFRAIQSDALSPLATVPQCLDNHWVPMRMLDKLLKDRKTKLQINELLEPQIRSEYIRSLINAEQVIINRAFLRNNRQVFRDFAVEKRDEQSAIENREAFKRFLGSGVIVPFLFSDRSPVDSVDFTSDSTGASAWRQVCRETSPVCLRLSWDDVENKHRARQMRLEYQRFARNLADTGAYFLIKLRKLRGLDAELSQQKTFREYLEKVSDKIQEQTGKELDSDGFPTKLITRETLYKEFVLSKDAGTIGASYDTSKPFSAELKVLFDLKYSTNLADAVAANALTPVDTPSRALMAPLEWNARPQASKVSINGDELIQALRRLRSTALDMAQAGLTFQAFSDFDLVTVEKVRNSAEWHSYITSVHQLRCNPLAFSEDTGGAAAIHKTYKDLLILAARFHKERRRTVLEREWIPKISMVIDAGAFVVSVFFLAQGGPIIYRIVQTAIPYGAQQALPLVFKVSVGEVIDNAVDKQLSSSVDFMKASFADGLSQFEDFKRMLEKDPIFKNIEASGSRSVQDATLNVPEPVYF